MTSSISTADRVRVSGPGGPDTRTARIKRVRGRLSRTPDPVFAYGLLLPAMVFFAAFTLWPVVSAVVSSFNLTDGGNLANYDRLASDPVLRQVLWNNFVYAVGTVPLSIALAIGMALWVNRQWRGRGVLRLAYFTPAILPMVAIAAIWLFFYTPGYGPVSGIATSLGFDDRNWLGSPDTVMPAIIIMSVWKEAGFLMIFYLAGLQNIPTELEEASALEGSSRWYHFRRVTFPLLMPTTIFAVIVALTNSFRTVDFLFILTQGGPNNASNLLLYYVFQTAFRFWDPAYAATLTLVLATVMLVLALMQLRLLERRTHYR
jgi:sn-glycerol 3-phosphate transport system permease protein